VGQEGLMAVQVQWVNIWRGLQDVQVLHVSFCVAQTGRENATRSVRPVDIRAATVLEQCWQTEWFF
jgi:hypothetical protein